MEDDVVRRNIFYLKVYYQIILTIILLWRAKKTHYDHEVI